ncbi:MAG: hypothetical protein D6767_05380 [Candidatus Hydrogenedentota bacterium]|nr:MAG: hypothetical protein D6767_05380 [Candidatus Hydrogenedentota bacterium]
MMPTFVLFPATWGVLPVVIQGNVPHTKEGPVIIPNRKSLSWDLQKTISLYLRASSLTRQISSIKIEKIWRKLKLQAGRELSSFELSQLSSAMDVDKFLVMQVYSGTQVQWESKVYYASSKILTDPIVTRSTNFWKGLGEHLRRRFPDYSPQFQSRSSVYRPAIFLLEATAPMGNILSKLQKDSSKIDLLQSGGCIANESTVQKVRLGEHPRNLKRLLKTLSAKGAWLPSSFYTKLVDCALSLSPYHGNPEDLPYIFFFVSSIPQQDKDKLRFKAAYRKLATQADIYLFLPPDATEHTRDFYREISYEQKRTGRSHLIELLMRQKVFSADGDSIYLFRKGNFLIESKKIYPTNLQKGIWVNASSQSIIGSYTRISHRKIRKSGKQEILLFEEFTRILTTESNSLQGSKSVRILLDSEGIPIWFSFPEKAILKKDRSLKIKVGETGYFLVNVEGTPREGSIPTSENFGLFIKNGAYVPKALLLPIEKFFKSPKRFLNHSIGGSSIYILSGKVSLIRVHE